MLLVLLTIVAQAQNIGVKTGTPNAVLDVNGSVAFREGGPLSMVNGVNNNATIDSMSFYRITGPTAAFSLTGCTAGFDGRILTLVNATNYTMTLKHLNTSSTAANRINTGGLDMTVAANGVVTMYYNNGLTNWIVTSSQGTPPNLTTIGIGSSGDSILVINNGIIGRVPPRTFIDYYAWDLQGNAGTVDGTNFLGTTDNVPLSIRVNNQKSGRIDNTNGNAFWGYLGGAAMTTGGSNVALGHQALRNNTTGGSNVAVGSGAMQNNVTGSNMVGVGVNALLSATGSYNVAVGNNVLSLATGASNVGMGYNALTANTSGAGNVAIGNYASYSNTTGGNNTAVGQSSLTANTTGQSNTAIASDGAASWL